MASSEEKTALFISTGAAVAAAYSLLSKKAASGGAGTDEALMNLLVAIAQNSQSELDITNQILDRMNGDGRGYPPNAPTFLIGTVVCINALQAYNMIPDYKVPDNFNLVLKNHPNNVAGTILYLGDTAGNATNLTTAWPLVIQESIAWKIKTTTSIWVASNTANALLCYTLEYSG